MITFLILLPVACTLVWLYWLCLPVDASRKGRWRWVDSVLLLVLIFLASVFGYSKLHTEYVDAGPIWADVVAATGAYLTFAIGLMIGLVFRRKSANK